MDFSKSMIYIYYTEKKLITDTLRRIIHNLFKIYEASGAETDQSDIFIKIELGIVSYSLGFPLYFHISLNEF